MGEVFLAHDTTLDRDVALKFLPERISTSETDRKRFILEAKAAAALSHPNICQVISIGQTGADGESGRLFIVMEYVDGRNLRDLAGAAQGSPLPIKQCIDIGIQVADGLAAAHEKGIVHRDIKPENIMVRKDGRVQIMDFGLAKLKTDRLSRLTREGSTMGTAGYMSPEQVQGQETDHRSDVFSLGVVLYEMFAGGMPFKGVHETAMMYEIVNVNPPPMNTFRPELDPGIDAIVLDCLEKDPRERYQSAAEVARALRRMRHESTKQHISRVGPVSPGTAVPTAGRIAAAGTAGVWKWLALAGGILSILLLALLFRRPSAEPASLHTELMPPHGMAYSLQAGGGHIALSPSGKFIAFVAVDTAGKSLLWVRSFRSSAPRALAGTEEAIYPFWSPDEKSIGYFSRGKMMRIEAEGGTPFSIADVTAPRGGTWNTDGVIVYAPDQWKGLYRVQASGGKPVQITTLDSSNHEMTHRWPSFLPDNDHFLFFARGSVAGYGESDANHIYVGSLSKGTSQQLMTSVSEAVYGNGMILYSRQNALIGQAFDPGSLRLSGDPVTIAQDIQYTPRWSRATFTVSQNGMLAYMPGGMEWRPDVLLVHRDGSLIAHLGRLDVILRASISPDGKQLAMDLMDTQSRTIDIWTYDIRLGIKTRLTFSKKPDLQPVWSPHGDAVAYSDGQGTGARIITHPISGAGEGVTIAQFQSDVSVYDWSPDGAYILFALRNGSNADLWLVPVAGERKPVPIIQTGFNEWSAKFSPDMKWIAYTSDESGKNEVYIRSFSPPGTPASAAVVVKRQISTDGGNNPVWRHDGHGIYYITPKGVMLADLKKTGDVLEVTGVNEYSSQRVVYFGDIHPSGDILITQTQQVAAGVVPLSLVMNWKSDLASEQR